MCKLIRYTHRDCGCVMEELRRFPDILRCERAELTNRDCWIIPGPFREEDVILRPWLGRQLEPVCAECRKAGKRDGRV